MAVDGYLEFVGPLQATGWAFDPVVPDWHLEIEIARGDLTIGFATAKNYRDDLEAGGIGRGDHSFFLTSPSR